MDNKGYSKTDSSEGIYRPIPKDNAVRDPHSRFVTFHYIVIINLLRKHNLSTCLKTVRYQDITLYTHFELQNICSLQS